LEADAAEDDAVEDAEASAAEHGMDEDTGEPAPSPAAPPEEQTCKQEEHPRRFTPSRSLHESLFPRRKRRKGNRADHF